MTTPTAGSQPGPRPPTWEEMRALVQSRGADLDDARPAPGGLSQAQQERWLAGHRYGPPRPNLDHPPAPPKPKRKVNVKLPTRSEIPPQAPRPTSQAAVEGGAIDRLAARLRTEGVDTARVGVDHRGRATVEVDEHQRDRAARLMGGWVAGSW